MRLLVCGGRKFGKRERVLSEIKRLHEQEPITLIIEGGAKGADRLARQVAEELGIPVKTFEADWALHGKGAGPIRNSEMLLEGKPDRVLAFPTVDSIGTWDMVNKANYAKIPVSIVYERVE